MFPPFLLGTAATLSLARSLPPLRGGGVGDFFSPDFSRKADQDAGKNKFVETAPTAVTAQADTNAVAKNTAEAGVQVQKEAPKKKAPVKMPELRTAVSIKNPGEVAMELKQKKVPLPSPSPLIPLLYHSVAKVGIGSDAFSTQRCIAFKIFPVIPAQATRPGTDEVLLLLLLLRGLVVFRPT